MPKISWLENSAMKADLTCEGRKQWAVLGTNASEILIAVFLNGTDREPVVLHYSAKGRNSFSVRLKGESLDYDPKTEVGSDLPGFVRSKTCKGLNSDDGMIDSAHIYWDRQSKKFVDWVR